VFCAGFCGSVEFQGEDPLIWPLKDGAVGGGGLVVVVLAGYVEGEVDESLGTGFQEG
jgi:hypothetical protein